MKTDYTTFAFSRARWDQLVRRRQTGPGQATHLRETSKFGSNPGDLRMLSYLPSNLPKSPALIVVLHGCMQTAAGYDRGAGWSTLADRNGFALLFPEQKRTNNTNNCFNWFQPDDVERDGGEAFSIRQMVEKLVVEQNIDRDRIFVTGLSSGGAMASAMLACYPDVFAGGAIIAGLPYGCATNAQEAFASMFQSPERPANAWGDLVRNAAPPTGRWPRVSVWHGGTDATVIPSNARETLKQWTNVHGLPAEPSAEGLVDGYPRQVWIDDKGDEVIESYTITDMAHGTPLATGHATDNCGAAGPFLLDVGISSSYHICGFFGLLTNRQQETRGVQTREGTQTIQLHPVPRDAASPNARLRSSAASGHGPILTTIEKALRAAGLMK